MRQISAFAFLRPTKAWVLVTADEDRRLCGLEAWTYRLFRTLLMCSDFSTGHGCTGYGELIQSLTPDQPAAGPRLWVPSRDAVKKALRALESLDLVAVDKVKSEKAKALFFHVQPRTRKGAPAKKLPPELTPTFSEVKQAEFTPRTHPGDSENKSLKTARTTQPVDNSAGAAAARDELRRISAAISARGNTSARAPEGA